MPCVRARHHGILLAPLKGRVLSFPPARLTPDMDLDMKRAQIGHKRPKYSPLKQALAGEKSPRGGKNLNGPKQTESAQKPNPKLLIRVSQVRALHGLPELARQIKEN